MKTQIITTKAEITMAVIDKEEEVVVEEVFQNPSFSLERLSDLRILKKHILTKIFV